MGESPTDPPVNLSGPLPDLLRAALAFRNRVIECEEHPSMKALYMMGVLRGSGYTGPNWLRELESLDKAIDRAERVCDRVTLDYLLTPKATAKDRPPRLLLVLACVSVAAVYATLVVKSVETADPRLVYSSSLAGVVLGYLAVEAIFWIRRRKP